jgi:hypothetical protein
MAAQALVTSMKVRARPCRACPFEGTSPLPVSPAMKESVEFRLRNLGGQHLCHSSQYTELCRGGRKILLRALVERGYLLEATDEAFEQARRELAIDACLVSPTTIRFVGRSSRDASSVNQSACDGDGQGTHPQSTDEFCIVVDDPAR